MCLELFGIDVLAVRQDDDVFTPACNGEIPFGVDDTEISGVEPSVRDRLGSLLLREVVPCHQYRTPDPDLTDTLFIWRIDMYRHSAKRPADSPDAVLIKRSDCRSP